MKLPSTSPRLASRVAATALVLSLAATSLASAAQAAISKPFEARQRLQLAPGIEYAVGTMKTSGGRRQSVRVATIDPRLANVRVRSVLSNDKVVRREVVTRMALRTSRPDLRAMVATNGDMSTAQRQDAYAAPQSMAISNGELLLAQACTRPTLGIDAGGGVRIGDVRSHLFVRIPGRLVPKQINRVNTHRDDGRVVLYTSRFAKSTRTQPGGVEVVVALSDLLRPHANQSLTVTAVRRGAGNSRLEPGQAVISVRNPKAKWVYQLKPGQQLELVTRVVRGVDSRCGGNVAVAKDWAGVVEAVGGNHFTARDGRLAAPSRAQYASGSQRHPRTGVGVTADGRLLMITVDGRRRGSAGVTLAEMGQLMTSLGATHSFNLDGGGSTVMARRVPASGRFKVANRPSDGRQRPATQALVVYTR